VRAARRLVSLAGCLPSPRAKVRRGWRRKGRALRVFRGSVRRLRRRGVLLGARRRPVAMTATPGAQMWPVSAARAEAVTAGSLRRGGLGGGVPAVAACHSRDLDLAVAGRRIGDREGAVAACHSEDLEVAVAGSRIGDRDGAAYSSAASPVIGGSCAEAGAARSGG
jgi:hypothetical protein